MALIASIKHMTSDIAEYEAETIPGIETFALDELYRLYGREVSQVRQTRPGFLRFRYRGAPQTLSLLRSIIAIYRIHCFSIPRPRALLGHEHFTRLTMILRQTAASFNIVPETLGIGAAGSQSSVFRRLRLELSAALALQPADDGKGELFLRLIRQADGPGWELLVRTTAQPLSKRGYRVADVPGALNATVAFAMTCCGSLPHKARVVNLCSGSSTILIEHSLTRAADSLFGVDTCGDMLNIGRRNTRAAGMSAAIGHLLADARRAPLPSRSVDRLYADLPFGHHIGSHQDNLKLYPAILQEAQRLAQAHTTFVVLTHEVKLMKRCLGNSTWQITDETVINLRGLHPRLFVLNQNSARIVK